MRIKECWLARYGPLAEMGRIPFGDFTLIFGENESGKTLLVDALIRMLFHRKSDIATFAGVGRVDESPEGYLILEIGREEFKLPEAGDITSLTGISAVDCRSVFIVRNSDLQVPEESAFYTSVTDRLTGIHSVAIERICKKLMETGRLTNPTSEAQLSDREDFGKVKSVVKRARGLIEQIRELEKQAEAESLEDLEREALAHEQQAQQLDFRLEQIELAGKREMYENAQQALDRLRNALQALQALEAFGDEGLEAWRDGQREVERLNGEIRELKDTAEETRKQLAEARLRSDEAHAEHLRYKEHQGALQDLQADVRIHRRRREQASAQAGLVKALGRAALVSTAALGLSVLGLLFARSRSLEVVALGSGLAAAVLFAWWLYLSWVIASVSGEFDRIRLDAASHGIPGNDIETLLAGLENYRIGLEERGRIAELFRQKVEGAEKELRKATDDTQSKRDQVGDHEAGIRELSESSGVSDLDSYAAQVGRMADAKRTRDIQAARLKEILGLQKAPEAEAIDVWEQRVQEYVEFADKATDVAFDREELESLRGARRELGERIAAVKEQLSDYRGELGSVAAEANSLLSPEEALPCETLVDLRAIAAKAEAFVDQVGRRKDLVIETIALFERVAEREAEKIGELFGEESPVSQRFEAITNGVYQEVGFDRARNMLWARKADGRALHAHQLSGGTYDQLYLAVRVALADRLLQGEQGFLILDDPFLTSDTRRLRRQMDILRELVKAGWQILYFSVKDEVRTVLRDDTRRKGVTLRRLSSVHA